MYIVYWTYHSTDSGYVGIMQDRYIPDVHFDRPSDCHMLIPTWEAFERAS